MVARAVGLALLLFVAPVTSWAEDGAETPESASEVPTNLNELGSLVLTCRRYLGAAAGSYLDQGDDDWENIGQGPVFVTASPAFAMSCDARFGSVSVLFGGETAPWYSHVTWNDRRVTHWATASGGLTFGSERMALGVFGMYGFNVSGAGLLADWRPFEGREGVRRGFQIRATGLLNGVPAGQLMVLYTLSGARLP